MTDIVERLRATTREAIAEIEYLRGNKKQPPDTTFLDTPVRDIDFGRLMNARVHHLKCWHFEGGEIVDVPVTTVRDLVMLTEAEILRSPNVGRTTLESIKTVLASHGLHLGMGL
jgi:hypothetical protein